MALNRAISSVNLSGIYCSKLLQLNLLMSVRREFVSEWVCGIDGVIFLFVNVCFTISAHLLSEQFILKWNLMLLCLPSSLNPHRGSPDRDGGVSHERTFITFSDNEFDILHMWYCRKSSLYIQSNYVYYLFFFFTCQEPQEVLKSKLVESGLQQNSLE